MKRCLLVLAMIGVSGVSVCLAQQTYQLDASGTWQPQAVVDPASAEGQLQAISKLIAGDQGKKAFEQADQWIEQHPRHGLLVQAHLLRGDALVSQKLYFKALFDYEKILTQYPAAQQYDTALEREYEIARLFAAGMKRRWAGMRIMKAGDEAEKLLILIQERSPGSEVGEKASILLGDYYFRQSQMDHARQAYELFLMNYPQSLFRMRAMLRLIQASLATFRGPGFDAKGLLDAMEKLRSFERQFPIAGQKLGAKALRVRVQESLALKMFYQARWYERVDKKVSAVYTYQRLVKDFPQTVAAQGAIAKLQKAGEPLTPTTDMATPDTLDAPDAPANE